MSLFKELQRRNVFKVVAGYLVLGWLILQIADVIVPALKLPDWTITFLLIVGLLGLPIVLFLAWAFEITPDGIKRESEVSPDQSISHQTGQTLNRIVIGLLIVALGYFVWESRFQEQTDRSAGAIDDKTVAVLPFLNMSDDKEQGWFADGLTEEILNALARTRDLKVSSRTSSFSYKGSEKDLKTIGQELNVAHILEGSIRRSGDKIRVTAQLIRVNDDVHLWSQTYDRDYKDVIGIQEDVARSIATALETAMDPAELNAMTQVGTKSVEAYKLFLKATALSTEELKKPEIIQLLEQALADDPGFTRAKILLGVTWLNSLDIALIGDERWLPPEEQESRGFSYLEQAIEELNDPVEETYVRAILAKSQLRFNDARALFEQVLEINPGHFSAIRNLFDVLVKTQDHQAVENLGKFTGKHLPHDAVYYQEMIVDFYMIKNFSASAQMASMTLEQLSVIPPVLAYQSVRAFLSNGEYDKAVQADVKVQSSDMPSSSKLITSLRMACASGDMERARQIAEQGLNNASSDTANKWLFLELTGRHEEATALMKPLDDNHRLVELSSLLTYYHFDVDEFPNLKAVLERQGIKRQPYTPPVLACKPD